MNQKSFLEREVKLFVTTQELAELLGLQPQTPRKWRCEGRGPRFLRLGRGRGARIRYAIRDVESWLQTQNFGSTTAADLGATTEVRG